MCAVALVAAAPPNPNKGKEVKEEKSPSDDKYEYELDEDVREREPCVARESCADPEEDKPRPGPSKTSAPKWPGECRGWDCLGSCREPGPRCPGVEDLDSDTDEE